MRSIGSYYGFLCLTAVIWGVQPVLVKTAIRDFSPSMLTVLRFLCISGTLLVLLYVRKERLLPAKGCFWPLFFMGLGGVAVNNTAQFYGLQYSTVVNVTLIASTTPAITALLAAAFLKEKLLPLQWVGIFVSLGGALYLVSHGAPTMLFENALNIGDALFLCSQIGWAIYSLISIRVMRRMSAIATTAWGGLFGAGLTLLYGLGAGDLVMPAPGPAAIGAFVFMVWVGGVCAMLLWNFGLKAVGPGQAAIFLNIMPVVGMLCGVCFLGETVGSSDLVGAGLILSGVYCTTHAKQLAECAHKHLATVFKA